MQEVCKSYVRRFAYEGVGGIERVQRTSDRTVTKTINNKRRVVAETRSKRAKAGRAKLGCRINR